MHQSLIWYQLLARNSPTHQLKPDFPAESLNHGEVDPEPGELLHKLEPVVATDVVTGGESGVDGELSGYVFSSGAITSHKQVECRVAIHPTSERLQQWDRHLC